MIDDDNRDIKWGPAFSVPAPDKLSQNERVSEQVYLPMDCPICGRRRVEWNGKELHCEKCTTSSEWDGFSTERYATELRAALAEALDRHEDVNEDRSTPPMDPERIAELRKLVGR